MKSREPPRSTHREPLQVVEWLSMAREVAFKSWLAMAGLFPQRKQKFLRGSQWLSMILISNGEREKEGGGGRWEDGVAAVAKEDRDHREPSKAIAERYMGRSKLSASQADS